MTNCLYRTGACAALFAIVALLAAVVGLSFAGVPPGASLADTLAAIPGNFAIFAVGYVAIALISLFDIFTVPGLYAALHRDGRLLIVLAAIAAVVGDLLGVAGGLIQTSLLSLTGNLAAAETVTAIEQPLTIAGFMLVGVSCTCFGLVLLRSDFGKLLGWVALATALFSVLGQLPALSMLFLLGNIGFLVWYVGIGLRFMRLAGAA